MMENRVHTSSGLTVYAQRRERLAVGPMRPQVGLTVLGRPQAMGSGFASRSDGVPDLMPEPRLDWTSLIS